MPEPEAARARRPRLAPDAFGASPDEWDDWRWQVARRWRTPADLRGVPGLDPEKVDGMARVARVYPFAVTPYFLARIRWEDPADPLRRQVLPDPAELAPPGDSSLDPLAEAAHTVAPGVIHRYPDRVVLLATRRCAVHCRHCFRKRLWAGSDDERDLLTEEGLQYVERHPAVRDVLLSGGDPLLLEDDRLAALLARVRSIPHVEIIRIGTRAPVVLPQRITPALCRLLDRHGPVWLLTQFNHPEEISPEAAAACDRLLRAGVPVGNQSVLLRGVNDDAETIASLCRGLLRIRVRPYYLHQCDPVEGAAHFRTPVERGLEILERIQGRISGMAVPRFVVDLPGRGGKVPLQPDYVVSRSAGRYVLRSFRGEIFRYENPGQGAGVRTSPDARRAVSEE